MNDCTARIQIAGGEILVDSQDVSRVQAQHWRIHVRPDWTHARAWVEGRETALHRFILGLNHGDGKIVDHINGDTLDNRRENLRVVTHQTNMVNRRRQRNNRSGYRGVHFDRGRWTAKIKHCGYTCYIGRFDTPESAARAVDALAAKLRGEVAVLNFPTGIAV